MSVTIYKDKNYQGVYANLSPGFYSGRDLIGCPHQSTSCEDLDNAINSIRVYPNVVVAFADSHAISASGGGARVLMGPTDVSDLTALAMNNRISSMLVVPFRAYDSAIPVAGDGVTLYESYAKNGRRSTLRRGDYPPSRLSSEEVKMPGPSVQSLQVKAGVVVILYNGSNFETTKDAVMVVGPTLVEDLDRMGMSGQVNSIRVLYSDPYDVPGRPVLALGSPRAYTPGGLWGYDPAATYSPSGDMRGEPTGALQALLAEDDAPARTLARTRTLTRDRSPALQSGPPPPGVQQTWKLFAIVIFAILVAVIAALIARPRVVVAKTAGQYAATTYGAPEHVEM